MVNYGIDVWGQDSFVIEDGFVKINHGNRPNLVDIVRKLGKTGIRGHYCSGFRT